jgi:hypothetical protein
MDLHGILNESITDAPAHEAPTAVTNESIPLAPVRKAKRKPTEILADLESELLTLKSFDTSSWTPARIARHESKVAKLTATVNTQQEKVTQNDLRETEKNEKATISVQKCIWTDAQTLQLIGARRLNEHHFVQHLQTGNNKWQLIADSYQGGFTLPKHMSTGKDGFGGLV